MDMPWKQISPTNAGREYLALLTYLPLKTYWAIPGFMRFTLQIQKRLSATAGVIGYALRAQPLKRDFWTLSVWESESTLSAFVREVPHIEAMKALLPKMGNTKFTRWKIAGTAVPPGWSDAEQQARREA